MESCWIAVSVSALWSPVFMIAPYLGEGSDGTGQKKEGRGEEKNSHRSKEGRQGLAAAQRFLTQEADGPLFRLARETGRRGKGEKKGRRKTLPCQERGNIAANISSNLCKIYRNAVRSFFPITEEGKEKGGKRGEVLREVFELADIVIQRAACRIPYREWRGGREKRKGKGAILLMATLPPPPPHYAGAGDDEGQGEREGGGKEVLFTRVGKVGQILVLSPILPLLWVKELPLKKGEERNVGEIFALTFHLSGSSPTGFRRHMGVGGGERGKKKSSRRAEAYFFMLLTKNLSLFVFGL